MDAHDGSAAQSLLATQHTPGSPATGSIQTQTADGGSDGTDPVKGQPAVSTGCSLPSRNYLAFMCLGLINNLAYVVILSGAQSLADSFNQSQLVGVIAWADVALGVVVRGLNVYLEGSTFGPRVFAATLLLLLGLVGLVCSRLVGYFSFCIVAIALCGASSSFGESVLLGYLKSFPSSMTGAWSSGTGLAGVVGSAWYLLLSGPAALSDPVIFATMLPSVFIYFGVFLWGVTPPTPAGAPQAVVPTTATSTPRRQSSVRLPALPDLPSFDDDTDPVADPHPTGDAPAETTCQRYTRVLNSVLWLSIMLVLRRVLTAILAFCYQVGVLISRSSLALLRIRRVWVLTLLQTFNFVLWLCQAKWLFIPVWWQFPLMVYVGLLGGAMYTNVFASIVDHPGIPAADKELAINLAALFINAGIVASAVIDVIIDETYLKT